MIRISGSDFEKTNKPSTLPVPSHMIHNQTMRLPVRELCQVKAVLPLQISSVQFSHSIVSDFLWPHGLQHARLPCPSPTPGACSNSCPSSRWCHPAISSSVIPFSSRLQSFPASWSFQMSQFFEAGSNYIWLLYWDIIHRGKVYNSMVLDILHYLIVAKYIQQNSPFKSL